MPTVYRNRTLRIPPMIPGSDQDYIYLTPPATAKLDPGDENSYGSPDAAWDLEYAPSADGQQWFVQTGTAITDLKTEPPSFSACQQALDGNAMNLETQDIIQGHGYCLTAQNGDTAYVFIDSLPPLDGGDSGPFTISVTLWQDNLKAAIQRRIIPELSQSIYLLPGWQILQLAARSHWP